MVCLAFILGTYIGAYEVNQYPTPRALFNLAGAYYDRGQEDKAIELLEVVANYETLYPQRPIRSADGKRVDQNSLTVIEAARENLKLLGFKRNFDHENDPLLKRGKP